MKLVRIALATLALLAAGTPAAAQGEVAKDFVRNTAGWDHERREVMIPMRDGVKLKTYLLIPKTPAAKRPLILTRTPYGAASSAKGTSPYAAMNAPLADEALLNAGYIRAYQDVRGRFGSEGDYVMNLPLRGPLNRTQVDQSTDTWDTIDWLVKNVPESNGRVGVTGVSYPGWLTLMALFDPHPALKAVVPMYPMVDGWTGDDFYHNGALRQTMFEWIYNMASSKDGSLSPPFTRRDLYEEYLEAGSADALAARLGGDKLATWRKIVDNPSYNAFWREQAVQDLLAKAPPTVPVLMVHGLFDQEDNYGGIAAYRTLEAKDANNDRVFLAVGPWSHGQSQGAGAQLGAIRWDADTSKRFRDETLLPFWDRHLKGDAAAPAIPPVLAFDTGGKRWTASQRWPADGRTATRKLYLLPGGRLGFDPPGRAGERYAEYVSDPAKPVPYRVRPNLAMYDAQSSWPQWLADDQRPFADRTDVLTFVSEPLTEPLTVSGPVFGDLFASTSGQDADWVVKLIDVQPPMVRSQAEMGGYQLMVSGDILRGRYRDDPARPKPVKPGAVERYRVRLPEANHTFLPGHRIMVQVQSSWFPLYDRNPQTWVDEIAKAKPGDYRKATHRVMLTPDRPSSVEVSVVQR
jgi:hypothetical protein